MDIRKIVDQALRDASLSGTAASKLAGSVNLVADIRRGTSPTIRRFEPLANVLGLEFYIGPPRQLRDKVSPAPEASALADLHVAVDRHWDGLENDYARRTWLAHLRRQFPELAGP